MYGLVPDRGRFRTAPGDIDITARSKSGTSRDHTAVVSVQTLLNSSGLHTLIPTIQEVSMEAVSSSVSVGENELSSGGLIYSIGPVKHFEEQTGNRDWVSGRTTTIINPTQVGNVLRPW